MLRACLRQRALLVEPGAQHLQLRPKSLTQRNLPPDPMNLLWNSVLSDITGVTGLLIIDAILNGERHPLTLARLRDERCRHDEATLAKALVGTWRVGRMALTLGSHGRQTVGFCGHGAIPTLWRAWLRI